MQSLSAIEYELETEDESVCGTSAGKNKEKKEREERGFRFQAYNEEWMSVLYWNGTFLIPMKKQSSHKYNPRLL